MEPSSTCSRSSWPVGCWARSAARAEPEDRRRVAAGARERRPLLEPKRLAMDIDELEATDIVGDLGRDAAKVVGPLAVLILAPLILLLASCGRSSRRSRR